MVFHAVEGCSRLRENRKNATWRKLVNMSVLSRGVTFVLFLTLAVVSAAAKDLALVSNKANDVQAVTFPDLIKICKGQMNRWPDGKPVTFVMVDPGSAEMKIVLQKVYESGADQVKTLIASANHGRTNHPAIIVVNSDEELVQKVASLPGAVGLVDVYSITGNIAVLRVASKLPLEPGYALHGN
jgi:ABC-type phosphate transport system substrate-binding protein